METEIIKVIRVTDRRIGFEVVFWTEFKVVK